MSVLPVEDTLGNTSSSLLISHGFSTDPGPVHLCSHASSAKAVTVAQMLFVVQAANCNPLYLREELLPPRSQLKA